MTKNEIVARWMGYKIGKLSGWMSGTSEIDYSYLKIDGEITKPIRVDKLKYDSSYDWLHEAWVRFRDLRFENTKHEMYHSQFCEVIRKAISDKTITQAFDELVKGIEWYESLKK